MPPLKKEESFPKMFLTDTGGQRSRAARPNAEPAAAEGTQRREEREERGVLGYKEGTVKSL